ncbi:MAG: hypothetical protein WB460_11600, partial [Candidatus Acidiferrales bacterium]
NAGRVFRPKAEGPSFLVGIFVTFNVRTPTVGLFSLPRFSKSVQFPHWGTGRFRRHGHLGTVRGEYHLYLSAVLGRASRSGLFSFPDGVYPEVASRKRSYLPGDL